MVKGKLALVTGGGGGMGLAVCQTLAAEGARVIATDINVEAAENTVATLQGSGHMFIGMDVSKEEEVNRTFENVISTYKEPPTIVINTAGIYINSDSFLQEDVKMMDRLFEVNFKGTFLVTQAACKALRASQLQGSIVNVASLAAIGNKAACLYGSTKAAVICLTKSVAREMGPFGIRCNVVSPGIVDTPMLHFISKEKYESFVNICSLGRVGTAQEIADLIVFLASDKSSYINATNVDINGGV